MKLLLICLLLLPLMVPAQTTPDSAKIGIGFSMGYSSRLQALGELYIAAKLSNHIRLYPVSFKGWPTTNPSRPIIVEPRIGYLIKHTEFYLGYGYHFAGQDHRKEFDQYKGFKPGAGIIQHLGNWTLTAAASGEVYSGTIGIVLFR